MDFVPVIFLGGLNVILAYVCFQKGKTTFGWLTLAGLVPFLAFLGVFGLVGAIRYAKPNSAWANARYDRYRMEIARRRFPQEPVAAPGPAPPLVRDGPGLGQDAGPGLGEDTALPPESPVRILRFLGKAYEAGVIDAETRLRLVDFLDRGQTVRPAPEAPVEPAPATPPRTPPPEPSEALPPWPPTAPAAAPAPAQPPPPPPPPSPLSSSLTRTWDAIASDIALHGFAYLGVVLTFIGVLGFLLFAFADLPDAAQPFVELFIALIFFGWAWILRRQQADRVANGMELVGGMVVPLIVFAGLVDNAPIPPDFTGGGLVAALTVSSLLLAAAYAWVSARHPESTLRFLVGPLVWLGAMTLGFVFKTDEPLASEAITRLVSPQPALASAAIALTLLACLAWRAHRLAEPTVRSALVGVPAAYLLTVSMAVGEDWRLLWPLVVLGVATLISSEVLARWFDRLDLLDVARPVLIAGVLAPMAPSVGIGWTGLTAVAAYLALDEWHRRRGDVGLGGRWLTLAGLAAGALMSLEEPIAAVAAFAALSVWAHVHRLDEPGTESAQMLGVAAAIFPAGVVFGLYELYDGQIAWLVMAIVLLVATIATRWLGRGDLYWSYWLLGANLIVWLGAVVEWWDGGGDEPTGAVTLGLVSLALAAAPRWPVARMWLTSLSASGALVLTLEVSGADLQLRQGVWALVGLALVLVAASWRRQPVAHLAAIGHLVATGSVISLLTGGDDSLVIGAWAVGWLTSAVADILGGDTLTGLLGRVAAPLDNGEANRASAAARWVVPIMAVATVPPALVTLANRSQEFAAHRSWTGVLVSTVAIIYASATRVRGLERPVRRSLGVGAFATSIIGVSVAAPDSWPTIYAVAAVLVVAALLSRDLRQVWFVWFAWVMTVVLTLLLADQLGVTSDSLHLVSLVWGAVMLLGALVWDDLRSGRREPGEGLRIGWLRYPVFVGALTVPVSLGPSFTADAEVFGWWAIGAAAFYLAVALLLRVGSVTAPAYALGAVGVTALSPQSLTDDPWLLVILAAPLVAISWLVSVRGRGGSESVWMSWELPPLVVAHGIALVALVLAAGVDELAPAALAFGLLSLVVSLWRRQRVWEEAGNLLVVLAAWDLGPGWLAIALAGTSVRAVVRASLASEEERSLYQGASVAAAGLAWVSFLVWAELSQLDAINYSMLLFGSMSLAVAGFSRWGRLRGDTALWWGALAMTGEAAAIIPAITPAGPGIRGPSIAIGLALTSLGFELGWKLIGGGLRYLAVAGAGLSWLTLTYGLGWDRPTSIGWTAIAFGLLAVGVSGLSRSYSGPEAGSDPPATHLARAWVGLGVLGVLVATTLVFENGLPDAEGYWVAVGLALLALSMALGAKPLVLPVMRDLSGPAALTSLLTMATTARWPDRTVAGSVLLVAASSTLGSLAVWRRRPDSPWTRSLVVLGATANVLAFVLAVGQLPALGLLIAVMIALGVQAIAFGVIRQLPGVLATGPPLLGGAFVLSVAESVGGSAQWFTAPLGLVLLIEVGIVGKLPQFSGDGGDRSPLVVLEWVGLGVLAGPPLVEMFTTSLLMGMLALAVAVGIFIWGVATRVRRRVIAAASLAVATMVLLIFAAAAGSAPDSAFFWIVAVGIGFSVMLVAGLLEAYRSRKGATMARLDQLMAGWE